MKTLPANVSLMTVILSGAVLLLSGITVLLGSIDLANSTKDSVSHELTVMRSTSCIEESLNKLKFDKFYNGTFQITESDGSCQSIVANVSGFPNLRSLTISSVTGEYHYDTTRTVDVSVKPYILTAP